MGKENNATHHLKNNLERISSENSIFNCKSGRKPLLSLGKGNISKWLERLLPNTRIVIEPKIIGTEVGIQYINGELNKAINENSQDITESLMSILNIPKTITFKNRLEIRGILYGDEFTSPKNTHIQFKKVHNSILKIPRPRLCAFQIFHCNINHFESLQELKNLNFEIPETHFTNFISDIDIYHQCWKEGKLFTNYPTSGLVLKINSRKLQKYLGEDNLSINWAYEIN